MIKIIQFAKKIAGTTNINHIKYITPIFIYKYKLTVFVPEKNTDKLMKELARSGAGIIGNYTYCSFRTKGTGTFKGSKLSNPQVGKKNRLEYAEENRLEMICEQDKLEKLTEIIYKYHPYEEPAFEIYPILVRNNTVDKNNCYIELKNSILLSDIIKRINKKIEVSSFNKKQLRKKIQRFIVTNKNLNEIKLPSLKRSTLLISKQNNQINIKLI